MQMYYLFVSLELPSPLSSLLKLCRSTEASYIYYNSQWTRDHQQLCGGCYLTLPHLIIQTARQLKHLACPSTTPVKAITALAGAYVIGLNETVEIVREMFSVDLRCGGLVSEVLLEWSNMKVLFRGFDGSEGS